MGVRRTGTLCATAILLATASAYAQVPANIEEGLKKIGQIVDPACTAKLYRPLMPKNDFNTYWPLIVPALASGFGVVWMYTYIGSSIPRELYEASEMDGAKGIATFFFVVIPIIRPGLAALGVWTLIRTWNDFQVPLVVLGDGTKFTVPLALTMLSTAYYSDIPAVMLATLMGLVPVFVLFALLSRQFIAGLTSGAVK